MAFWDPLSKLSYEDYLQANSFVKDITGQIKSSEKEFSSNFNDQIENLQSTISDQAKELIASNEELSLSFEDGFNSMENTLEWGFVSLSKNIKNVQISIETLNSAFNYGMGLIVTQLQNQSSALSSLLDKMDAIHKTLESPILTQAREFYRIGCDRLSKGLLDKALEAFLESAKKNDTDFFTQYNIGKIYLYGIDADDNVLDLIKAKEHLLLAARYAKAEMSVDISFKKLAAEAFLQSSFAIYFQLGDKNILNDPIQYKELLTEAKKYAKEAIVLNPMLSESFFHLAKYNALLQSPVQAIENLERAIVSDRNYAIKVDIDHAFDPIRKDVFSLLDKLKKSKQEESKQFLRQAEESIKELQSWHLESSILDSQYLKCKEDFTEAQKYFDHNTYFGFLDSTQFSYKVLQLSPSIKNERIQEMKNQFQELIKSAQQFLPDKKLEYSKDLNDLIESTSQLISKASSNTIDNTYISIANALSLAEAAKVKAEEVLDIVLNQQKVNEEKRQRELEESLNKIRIQEMEKEEQQKKLIQYNELVEMRNKASGRLSKKYGTIAFFASWVLTPILFPNAAENIVSTAIPSMAAITVVGMIFGAWIGQTKNKS